MPINFGTDGWRAVISETFTFHNLRMVTQAIADAVASEGWLNGIKIEAQLSYTRRDDPNILCRLRPSPIDEAIETTVGNYLIPSFGVELCHLNGRPRGSAMALFNRNI